MSATSQQETFKQRTMKNTIAGTAGGIAICLVGHPFDTLKVRLQTQPVRNPVYSGLADCFVKTLRWEGIGGLYRGVGSPIVGQMFFRATLFLSYYQLSSSIDNEHLGAAKPFLVGSMTGSIVAFVEGPIDLFKTKLQIQIMQTKAGQPALYRNVFHAGWMIGRQFGVRGVYQGLSATLLRNIPANAMFFGFMEMTKRVLTPKEAKVAPPWVTGLGGGIGGFLYWFLTYPTDVIKSAMQSDSAVHGERRFRGIVHCVSQLYTKEGGVRRFFKGLSPCLLRSIPANATMFVVVEQCRHMLDRYI